MGGAWEAGHLPCHAAPVPRGACVFVRYCPADGEVVLEGPERQDDADDEARRGDQKQPESEPESLVDSP